MTVEEAAEKRNQLLDEITRLVHEFEKSTGLVVELSVVPGTFIEIEARLPGIVE